MNTVSRRDFLRLTGFSGAGFVLAFPWTANAQGGRAQNGEYPLNAYISIGAETGVQLIIPAPEIGQGIRTTLAMVLADEMDADLEQVTLHQATANEAIYGKQVTGGSQSVRRYFNTLREAGAAAREMLLVAAAKEWGVSAGEIKAEKSEVVHPSFRTRRLSYSALAETASRQSVPQSPRLKKASERTYISKYVKNVDGKAIMTGAVDFGIDAKVEGMLFAVCIRPPVFKAKLKSFDDKVALSSPDVVAVKRIGDKVGVYAKNTWAAMNGAMRVACEWDNGRSGNIDTDSIEKEYTEGVKNPENAGSRGQFEAHYSEAEAKVESMCSVPFLAHVPLEPPNCTAWVKKDSAEVWAPCQNLVSAEKSLPRIVGMPMEKITFHTMRIGGGFGRKLRTDYIEEAVALSKAIDGPVKLTFSRTDDIRHSHYRKAISYKFRAGLDAKGKPQALELTSVGGFNKKKFPRDLLGLAKHSRYRGKDVKVPLQFGPLRAPWHNANAFAYETFVDEMAVQAGVDPLTYRLALYGDRDAMSELHWSSAAMDKPNFVKVLREVKERSGWKSDSKYGYGISTFDGYGSQIAIVALAPKAGGARKIEKCYAVVHCGLVVSPSGAVAQIEGGIIDALGATFHQKITLSNGAVQQNNYSDYKLMKMNESPEVDVHFIPSEESPQGLGEVSYPAAPAAACNALFAATGKRPVNLPV